MIVSIISDSIETVFLSLVMVVLKFCLDRSREKIDTTAIRSIPESSRVTDAVRSLPPEMTRGSKSRATPVDDSAVQKCQAHKQEQLGQGSVTVRDFQGALMSGASLTETVQHRHKILIFNSTRHYTLYLVFGKNVQI